LKSKIVVHLPMCKYAHKKKQDICYYTIVALQIF
jgi:hypothetical protein